MGAGTCHQLQAIKWTIPYIFNPPKCFMFIYSTSFHSFLLPTHPTFTCCRFQCCRSFPNHISKFNWVSTRYVMKSRGIISIFTVAPGLHPTWVVLWGVYKLGLLCPLKLWSSPRQLPPDWITPIQNKLRRAGCCVCTGLLYFITLQANCTC